jgi:uncharacterized protein with HEPN domain
MRPEDRDAGYVWDMLDAAGCVRDFTQGVTREAYLQDRKLQLAIERALEIIGEAARLVSAEFKALHPEVPWKKIIGQRNVLAHEYGEVNQDRIWLVASNSVPELIDALEPLLPPLPSPDDSTRSDQ